MQTFCTFYFSAKRFLAEPRGLATFWKSKKSKTYKNIVSAFLHFFKSKIS